jgi:uncharacterized membrane protein
MNNKTKNLTYNAIIAALYVTLVFALNFMSYEAVQIRLAEVLIFLVLIDKKYTLGICLGCFIANLIGPFGIIDAVMGTTATYLCCLFLRIFKRDYLALIIVPICNILVGVELAFLLSLNTAGAIINTLFVMLGEFICMIIGLILYRLILKKLLADNPHEKN